MRHPAPKVRLGKIHADSVTMAQALEHIATLAFAGVGGFVVTPNVDHLCLAETTPALESAYKEASLSLVDGTPLLWLAKFLGVPFPEKISGSDFVLPLMAMAANQGLRVYLLGGVATVGPMAAKKLIAAYPGLNIVGVDSPPLGFEKNDAQQAEVLAKIAAAKPHILLVALGCPKQELWMAQHSHAYAPAVAVGIGATLDFIAGVVRRAPAWMSRCGLEWVYRLVQEPRRMAQRYLVRDRAIFGIAWRMSRSPKSTRLLDD